MKKTKLKIQLKIKEKEKKKQMGQCTPAPITKANN
jgi:hypothetical protein